MIAARVRRPRSVVGRDANVSPLELPDMYPTVQREGDEEVLFGMK